MVGDDGYSYDECVRLMVHQKGARMSKLQQFRKGRNMTQAELAERAGISVRTLQGYEQGFKDMNKAQAITVYKLSKVLCCRMEDLIDEDVEG